MYEKLYNDASKYKTDITKGIFYFYNPIAIRGKDFRPRDKSITKEGDRYGRLL